MLNCIEQYIVHNHQMHNLIIDNNEQTTNSKQESNFKSTHNNGKLISELLKTKARERNYRNLNETNLNLN